MTLTLFVRTNTNPEGRYYFGVTKFRPSSDTLTFNYILRKPTMGDAILETRCASFDMKWDNWDVEVISRNGRLSKDVPEYIKKQII